MTPRPSGPWRLPAGNPIPVRTLFIGLGLAAGLAAVFVPGDATAVTVRVGIITGLVAWADLTYGQEKVKERDARAKLECQSLADRVEDLHRLADDARP